MLYAAAAAVICGVACGALATPFWPIGAAGLAAAALAIRLEWDALGGAASPRRANFALLLAAAFVFLAIIGVGLASVGYLLGEAWFWRCAGHGC